MKILILSFYYEPDICAGAFRVSAFVNSLREKISPGTQIDVVTTMPNRYHSYSKGAKAVEQDGNINVKRIQLPLHKNGFADQVKAFGFYFFSTLRHIASRDYDVVYATSSRLFTAFLGAVAARQHKAGLYLDIRDIFTDTMKSLLSPGKQLVLSPGFSLVEKFTICSADRVNLVSKGFDKYFKKISRHQDFSYFTNGIDDEFLDASYEKKQTTDIKQTTEEKQTTDKKIITYAGNFGQGQGLEHIIPQIACKLEDKFEFWLVGDGGRRSVLAEKIKSKNIKNIKIMDPVTRLELISIYGKSDYLFLHLNDYPAFKKVLPSKIFEYAVTGKPILAGVKGYSRQFIQNNLNDTMLFEPCSPGDFLEKFREFEPVLKPRTQFVQSFSRKSIMDQMADEFLNFYGIKK